MAGELRNPWPLAGALTAVCGFTLVGGATYVVLALQPEPIRPVTGYAPFRATDGAFACLYPKEWKKEAGGSAGVLSRARFSQGLAQIDITADLAGSLFADIERANEMSKENLHSMMGIQPIEDRKQKEKPPVEKLHDAQGKELAKQFKEYSEQPARPFQTPFGEGRYSEFTSKGGLFGSRIRGYHATLLGSERRIAVIAFAPEQQWSLVKQPFERVIGSLSPGGS